MTLLSKSGSFTAKTSTGSQTVTGVGFTPVAVIFFYSVGGTPMTGFDYQIGIGFAANNSGTLQQGAIGGAAQDNVAAGSNADERRWTSASCIAMPHYNATMLYEAALTSFNSDGFVLSWATAWSGGTTVYYLALGGTDITGAGVVSWLANGTTGNQDITTAGFQPTSVITIGTGSTAASPALETQFLYHIGAMDDSGNQWARFGYNKYDTNPTATGRFQLTDSCIVGSNNFSSTVHYKASYVSMLSNGFRINWGTVDGTQRYFLSLCLAGIRCKAGSWAKSTAAATVSDTISGLTITPIGVLAVTDSYVVSAAGQTGDRASIGVSDGTTNGVAGGNAKNNVATTYAKKFGSNAASLVVEDNDTQTQEAIGTMGSFAAGQFQATWTTNNAVATQICYVAFGSLSATASPTKAGMEIAAIAPSVTLSQTLTPTKAGMEIATRDITPQISTSPSPTVAGAQFAVIAPSVNITGEHLTASPTVVAIEAAAISVTPKIDASPSPTVAGIEATARTPSLIISASPSPTVAAIQMAAITPSLIIDATSMLSVVEIELETIQAWVEQDATITTTVIGFDLATMEPVFYTEVPPIKPKVIDFNIDERATRAVRVTMRRTGKDRFDLTGATIEWEAKAKDSGELLIKSTDDASIVLGDPDPIDGKISVFSLMIFKHDIVLPPLATYYAPVVYKHEGRIKLGNGEYIGIRGRMFVWPSQT